VTDRRDIPWVLDRAIVFGLPIVVLTLLQRGGVLARVGAMMDQAPPSPVVWLLAVAVVAAPAVLVHELGHAVVARMLVGGAMTIRVGAPDRGVKLRMGDVTVSLDPVGSFWGPSAGSVKYDTARATNGDALLVLVAGPLASLAAAAATLRIVEVAGPHYGVPHTLMEAFFLSNAMAAANLLPFRLRQLRGGRWLSSDGRVIMDAVAELRARRR
jgi:membrane-associated protease RseP (regulator of RpoE activity)